MSLTFSFVKSMFAIGWLELGEAEKAQLLLQKCFQNIQEPFQVSTCLAPLHKKKYWLTDADVLTCPLRCGASRPMALVSSTFSQEWEDSCRLCSSVTLASGQWISSPS